MSSTYNETKYVFPERFVVTLKRKVTNTSQKIKSKNVCTLIN